MLIARPSTLNLESYNYIAAAPDDRYVHKIKKYISNIILRIIILIIIIKHFQQVVPLRSLLCKNIPVFEHK